MPAINLRTFWLFLRPLLPPLLIGALILLTLREPLTWWLYGEEIYDQEAIKEWVREARNVQTLPEQVKTYVTMVERFQHPDTPPEERRTLESHIPIKREEIYELLKALCNPPTKMYAGQLPLFPIIYRLTVRFDESLLQPPIVWDSELPRQKGQFRQLQAEAIHPKVWVDVQYHLHAYMQRQFKERQEATRRFFLGGLVLFFAVGVFLWIYVNQWRERQRQRQRLLAEQQLHEAERGRLEEELRRQDAERLREEVERQNLELKSQIFANIGIMAGSYAHNIKNLLVRPNDLLRRCLEEKPGDHNSTAQADMLREVKQTLGTVTERLQQILQTVRRDPTQSEKIRLDLNALVRDMQRTWSDLAREKWKINLEIDLENSPGQDLPAPLWIEGDVSHLQQAVENLLFNARDATFEMRNYLRDQARTGVKSKDLGVRNQEPGMGDSDGAKPAGDIRSLSQDVRQALISAAAWKGQILLRTRLQEKQAVLEIHDNGVGMTEEVRRRCTETHFSTKRNNALFAGLSAGMGLGLSFVTVILEHHQAKLEIESKPFAGTIFRIVFPPSLQPSPSCVRGDGMR